MERKTLEQTIDRMRNFINLQVAAGFATEDEIVDTAVEVYSDEQPSAALFPHARRIVAQSREAHLQEQANWEIVTDYDRLTNAFEDLENQGIISRQNFSCCGTCCADEILDEVEEATNKCKNVHGYAFFHMQDTEHAVEGQGLYLSYGSGDGNPLAAVQIGHRVADTLKQHGLVTEWNGKLQTRIHVQMDWKRRQ